MENIEIAQILNQVADILEIKGGNKFKIGALRKAAQVIEGLPQDINEIFQKGELDKIPGVGKGIEGRIEELLKTGQLKELNKLRKKVPPGVVEMMQIEGLGPKTTQLVYKKFGVKTITQLEKLVKAHKLQKLKGFKAKTEENILRGIELYRRHGERFLLGRTYFLVQSIIKQLKKCKETRQISMAGSVRRMKETIGDLDILVTSQKPHQVMDYFCRLPEVKEIKAKGRTKSNVVLSLDIEADLRVVEPRAFGAALHYFTGSKEHNIHVRKMGVEQGLKINEYGVFRLKKKKEKRIAGRTEEEVFKSVGLPWIEPELREDRGEIEAAQKGKLPKLIKTEDIKGDFHIHTNWSDGEHSLEEMVKAAKKKGYEYIAITDHASPLGILGGITPAKLLKQLKQIKRLQKKMRGIKVLAGTEVDILPNGKIFIPNEVLAQLDMVIAAVHSKFRMSEKEMTARILKAVRNPQVDIIAHPTGRIIGRREPYEVDLDKVMDECKKTKTILEVNAFWDRLDLNDVHCRLAKDKGVKVAIGTDAHNKKELDIMKFGVATARRGWLEKKDVVNNLSWSNLKNLF